MQDELKPIADWLAEQSTGPVLWLGEDSPEWASVIAGRFGEPENWARLPAAVEALEGQPRHALAVWTGDSASLLEQPSEWVLSRLRDTLADAVLVIARGSHEPEPVAGKMRALGFMPLARSNELSVFSYDVASYNEPREWNTPENWANPENFDRYRW